MLVVNAAASMELCLHIIGVLLFLLVYGEHQASRISGSFLRMDASYH
jgi:hypothetical protein